jgi:hypothetical protein
LFKAPIGRLWNDFNAKTEKSGQATKRKVAILLSGLIIAVLAKGIVCQV